MSFALFQRNLVKYGKTITLQDRAIVPVNTADPDFNELFTDTADVLAIIKTPRGKTIFDGVSVDQVITHEFCMAHLAGVTSETWVEYAGNRYDIVDIENCGELDALLILRCNIRGSVTKESTKK